MHWKLELIFNERIICLRNKEKEVKMRIEKMTKRQLLIEIEKANRQLNDPQWIRSNTKWLVGVVIVHRNKLREQLAK